MKTTKTLKTACTGLFIVLVMFCHAQLDLKMSEASQVDYEPLEDFEREFGIPQTSERVDLGFELESYGAKCSSIYVSDAYFFFDWMMYYSVEVVPVGLFNFEIDRSKGTYRVKHSIQDGKKILVIEANKFEYVGLPYQTFSFQCTIREDGEFTLHYGENTLDGNHPLNNEMAYVGVSEQDFEKKSADPQGEEDYYRSIVNPYGEPTSPMINTEPSVYKLNYYPPQNTLYTINRTSFTGIKSNNTVIENRIFPNPVDAVIKIPATGRQICSIKIIDLLGKLVLERAVDENETLVQIQTSALPAGQYLMTVLDRKGHSEVVKILIK